MDAVASTQQHAAGAGDDRTAVADLYASLHQGYARYELAIAGAGLARRFRWKDEHPSRARDVAVGLLAAHAVASVVLSERRTAQRDSTAWMDAGASAAASVVSLTAGSAMGPVHGVWPASIAGAPSVAQWSSAGASLLGRRGKSRAARLAVVAAPYLLWPRGRRWLRDSGLLGETTIALVVFAATGRLLVSGLRSTADRIDRRAAQLVTEREVVAALEQDALIRDSVIAGTAARLRTIRESLVADRSLAAAQARREEHELRSWLRQHGDAVQGKAADPSDPVPSADTAETAEGLERFLEVSESLLRAGAAAQLLFEVSSQKRPRSAGFLALSAVAHAAWSCWQINASAPIKRNRVVASDLAVLALASGIDVAESRRGWEPGWTRGYTQAMSAATGAIGEDTTLAVLAAAGVGAISALSVIAGGGDPQARRAPAVEKAAYAASITWLTHWFAVLVGGQAERLSRTTAQLAAVRASAAADAVRLNNQYFLHDSALQVLLWLQKPDLSDEQLLAWLDREIPRLETAAAGEVTPEPRDLRRELEQLLNGFELLGLHPDVRLAEALPGLPVPVVKCTLDICNEGLANVLKHSTDTEPTIRLTANEDWLTLRITNTLEDSGPTTAPVPGTGSGAMVDRASGIGGSVELRPDRSSFEVRARLPVRLTRSTQAASDA
jgi:hypothetical protein